MAEAEKGSNEAPVMLSVTCSAMVAAYPLGSNRRLSNGSASSVPSRTKSRKPVLGSAGDAYTACELLVTNGLELCCSGFESTEPR